MSFETFQEQREQFIEVAEEMHRTGMLDGQTIETLRNGPDDKMLGAATIILKRLHILQLQTMDKFNEMKKLIDELPS